MTSAANPTPPNVELDVEESVATIRIAVAPERFLALIRNYLVEP